MRTARALSLLFLAALFLYAGLDKAFHYGGFVKALAGYVVVPEGLERHLALPVILTELLVGAGLLVRSWRCAAALVAAALLSAFIVALAVNRQVAPGAECGCWFTLTLGKATGAHILLDLVLLGLAVTVWLDERRTAQASLAPSLERSSS
jgi:uncharacterized membrane protein YphA (DoxX/SURF4 family)